MKNVSDKDLAYLDEQTGLKYLLIKFFNRWYWTPTPTDKDMTLKNELEFAFKVLSARAFFYLGVKRIRFISWITQYYPFSTLWTNCFFHFAYKPIHAFSDNLQEIAKKAGIGIVILGGNAFEDRREFSGYFRAKVHNKKLSMKKLEDCLQSVYETIYIRDTEKGFRIIVPNNLVH